MKFFHVRTAIVIFSAIVAWPACAQTASPAQCQEVRVANVVPGSGSVMLAVWASKEAFFKKPALSKKIPAAASTVTAALCGLEMNELAITVYQDLNDNGKLDANFIGIPSEPTGASGSPSRFKAPDWESTRIQLQEGKPIEIRL